MLSRKKLNVRFTETAPHLIDGDSFLLYQAVSNLIQNAVDFSLPHDQIELSVQSDDVGLIFMVEDNGPGIPEYAHGKIFDKFFSLQRPAGKKSTGLGLNFVKEIALLHNGEVALENRPGKGARAILRVPL